MKQILQSYRDGRLWLEEVPAPGCPERGVLVQTSRSVISAGTERMLVELARKSLLGKAMERPDLVRKVLNKARTEGVLSTVEKVFAKLDAPVPLGYSCVGRVLEIGAAISGIVPGERVACAGAGIANHAEINAVPLNLCASVPDAVSDDDAAFTTIGAIALQGVRQAEPKLGETVCVIGLGLIGLLSVQIAKAAGCRVVGFDPSAIRCKRAAKLGADAVCHSPVELRESVKRFSSGRGADSAIIAAATVSNAPVLTAIDVCRLRGVIVVVGAVKTDIPRDEAYSKELDVRFSMSYGPGRYDPVYEQGGQDYPYAYVRWTEQRNMDAFLQLVAERKVTPSALLSHRFVFDDAVAAYELLRKGQGARTPPAEGRPTAEGNGLTSGCKPGLSARRSPDDVHPAEDGDVLAIVLDYPRGDEPPVKPERKVVRHVTPVSLDKVGISFIGAGSFASGVLLPVFRKQSDVALRQVCTTRGMTAEQAAKRFGFAVSTTDVNEILNDKSTDAVVIATRHSTHAGLVCRCLEADKHVFVEKPLCVNMSEFEEISKVHKGKARLLHVGYNRRFSKHTIAVRDYFEDTAAPLTVLYRIQAGSLPADSWVTNPDEGGDRIVGEMCHFLDLCGCFCSEHAKNIYAVSTAVKSNDRSISATINYVNGAVAVVQYIVDGTTELPKEYVEVSGGGRTAVIDNFVKTQFYGDKRKSVSGSDKGIATEIEAFVRSLKGGERPSIAWEAIAQSMRVTFAVRESARTQSGIELA